jgi:3-mercaptopyruvate sulfurtransferase SseA
MRFRFYTAAAVVLGAILFSACNSAEQKKPAVAETKKTTPASQDDGVRRVTVQELQDMLAQGQAVVIDVRNQAAYDQGHIKGAKLIPFNEIVNRTSELPKDKLIVTYCS